MTLDREQLLLIAGAKASGKGMIRGVLDSHPDVFVSPYHELILQAFSREEYDQESLHHKDIEYVRKLIACRSKYYQLERFAIPGKYDAHTGASAKTEDIAIDYDFYEFDKSWVTELITNEQLWTPSTIITTIYRSFSKIIQGKTSNKKYYAGLSDGFPGQLTKFLQTIKDAKVIYVKRNPIDIVSSLIMRRPTSDFRSLRFTRDSLFQTYGQEEFIKSLFLLDAEAERLGREYPDRVLIFDFEDIFSHYDLFIDRLVGFLNIMPAESLWNYSIMGNEIKLADGSSPIDAPIDKKAGDLTEAEIEMLRVIVNKVSQENYSERAPATM